MVSSPTLSSLLLRVLPLWCWAGENDWQRLRVPSLMTGWPFLCLTLDCQLGGSVGQTVSKKVSTCGSWAGPLGDLTWVLNSSSVLPSPTLCGALHDLLLLGLT